MQAQWSKTDTTNKENKPQSVNTPSNVSTVSTPAKYQTVTPEIQLTIDNCHKRCSSFADGSKYKCAITSDRLLQLKKMVEVAAKDCKIFKIKGAWPIIRGELKKRNWLEKIDHHHQIKKIDTSAQFVKPEGSDDIVGNLPVKQDWESPKAYVEKCERLVISRLLHHIECNFYWSMRKDIIDLNNRANPNMVMNRFSRSLFASKEGLALLLQNSHWYTEAEVSSINFPRCYVLGFPDHFDYFVDNFRMTACISLLKIISRTTQNIEEVKYELTTPEGRVPLSAIQFAIDRCTEYVASQKHLDIDKDFQRIWDHEWDSFLTSFYTFVHENQLFKHEPEVDLKSLCNQAQSILKDVAKYSPEFDTDGEKNIWILKPGNKCRGRGIQLIKYLRDVEKVVNLKLKYVVQKYIERPLIIYNTKFDIRQWFLVTSVQPLVIWIYKYFSFVLWEAYLRFSSQDYNLENFHESLHLTNYAVQCKYTNMEQRNCKLPKDNMWDNYMFKEYLADIGQPDKWETVIYPGLKENIVCAMLASQDTMDRRQNTFEVYGADFMLSENFQPMLLEINCSPDMSASTSVTKRMCPQVMADVIKVVIDRKRDPKADTGLFEQIYKQVFPRAPPYLGSNLSIRGRRLLRNKSKAKSQTKQDKEKENKFLFQKKRASAAKAEALRRNTMIHKLPKIAQQDLYQGPVIEDLIEELQKCCTESASNREPLNQGKKDKSGFLRKPKRKKSTSVKN